MNARLAPKGALHLRQRMSIESVPGIKHLELPEGMDKELSVLQVALLHFVCQLDSSISRKSYHGAFKTSLVYSSGSSDIEESPSEEGKTPKIRANGEHPAFFKVRVHSERALRLGNEPELEALFLISDKPKGKGLFDWGGLLQDEFRLRVRLVLLSGRGASFFEEFGLRDVFENEFDCKLRRPEMSSRALRGMTSGFWQTLEGISRQRGGVEYVSEGVLGSKGAVNFRFKFPLRMAGKEGSLKTLSVSVTNEQIRALVGKQARGGEGISNLNSKVRDIVWKATGIDVQDLIVDAVHFGPYALTSGGRIYFKDSSFCNDVAVGHLSRVLGL